MRQCRSCPIPGPLPFHRLCNFEENTLPNTHAVSSSPALHPAAAVSGALLGAGASHVMNRPAPPHVNNLLWKLSDANERHALLRDAPPDKAAAPAPDTAPAPVDPKISVGGSLDRTSYASGVSHGSSKTIAANGDYTAAKTTTFKDGSHVDTRTTGSVTDIHGKSTPINDDHRGRAKPDGSVSGKIELGPNWAASFGPPVHKTGGALGAGGKWSAQASDGRQGHAETSASISKDGVQAKASGDIFAGAQASACMPTPEPSSGCTTSGCTTTPALSSAWAARSPAASRWIRSSWATPWEA
jgi:hypothetical protein